MSRFLALLLSLLVLAWPSAALADVRMHFHSFNGSVVFGRYPHTFVVLEGTLGDGQQVNENYGFSARRASPAVLRGPVEHMILIEEAKYITTTNRHFTVTITDAQYRRVRAEMERWRDAPGKFYDLETRNCIHFVGTLAQIAGLRVEYPQNMLRRPKQWLNHVTAMNPQLGAGPIR